MTAVAPRFIPVLGLLALWATPALAGSFMDYVMPRADDFPMFAVGHNEVPTETNLMGAKGGGEGGINGVGAAIAGAIDDAIGLPGAVTQLPVTPQRMKQLLQKRG